MTTLNGYRLGYVFSHKNTHIPWRSRWSSEEISFAAFYISILSFSNFRRLFVNVRLKFPTDKHSEMKKQKNAIYEQSIGTHIFYRYEDWKAKYLSSRAFALLVISDFIRGLTSQLPAVRLMLFSVFWRWDFPRRFKSSNLLEHGGMSVVLILYIELKDNFYRKSLSRSAIDRIEKSMHCVHRSVAGLNFNEMMNNFLTFY